MRKFLIGELHKIGVGDVDSNILKVLKSRFVKHDEQSLHVFAENGPVSDNNLITLNKLRADLAAIPAIDNISANIGFAQCQIPAGKKMKTVCYRRLGKITYIET